MKITPKPAKTIIELRGFDYQHGVELIQSGEAEFQRLTIEQFDFLLLGQVFEGLGVLRQRKRYHGYNLA